MTESTLLNGLNEYQRQAVTAPLGHALILAGAGSGKTRVLVSRMAWLIEQHGYSPQQVLAVTFTNKAAGEIMQRLGGLLGYSVRGLWVGTFHGLCHRFLRRHFNEAKLPQNFQIMDQDDQSRLIKRVMHDMNLDPEQWPVKQAQHFINQQKDAGIRPQHVAALTYGPSRTWLAIYSAYERACQNGGLIDFAEILLRTHELFRDNSEILHLYQQQFNAILVDEFQDTNTVQYAWIRLLAGTHAAFVMVVGDDDQSIYGWRGAKVENIQRFADDFKDVNCIRLEQNYRSTATILNASNALIARNQSRMGKALWTAGAHGEKISLFCAANELDESRFVKNAILDALHAGESLDDIAILYRSNVQSRVLEETLLMAGIAYRIHGGMRFFERAEIKDAMAYLRLVVNPNDDNAFERIVNFPTRGIGEKTLTKIRSLAQEHECSRWQAAVHCLSPDALPKRAALALQGFMQLITTLQEANNDTLLQQQLINALDLSGLIRHYDVSKTDQAQSKLENLHELVNAAASFELDQQSHPEEYASPLVAFIAHASLESGDTQAQVDEQHVHLMTLHAAKGLEFQRVFLVGMEEGVFPGKQSMDDESRIEEERRLCYVGMTRAKQNLCISFATIRRQYGREEYHRASRFIRELPQEYLHPVGRV